MSKLFIYDYKHQQVHAELELGELTPDQWALMEKLFPFFEENELTTRYKALTIAKSYEIVSNDGESEIKWAQ